MIKCGKDKNEFKCYRRWRETFYDLGNVHDWNNGISRIHKKELPEQLSIHRNHKRSHTQTNFRHIYEIGVWPRWDLNNWLGKSFMEIPDINWWRKNYQFSAREGLRLFRFCIVSWEDPTNPESNEAWEQRLGWNKSSQIYRNLDRIDGEPMEFEWNIFPIFDTLQICDKVKSLLSTLGKSPKKFTIIFLSMFNDISCGTKDNERECSANAKVVSIYMQRSLV